MSSSQEIINLTKKFIENYKMNYKDVKISNNQIKHYNKFIEFIQNDFNSLSSVDNSNKNIQKEKILENINTSLEEIISIINTSIKNDNVNLQSIMKKIKTNILDNTDILQRKDGNTNDIIDKIIDQNTLLSYNYDIDGSTGYNLDDLNCFFYEYKDINIIYSSALFTLFAFIKQKDPKFNFIKNKLSKFNDIKNKIYNEESSGTINIADDSELPENINILSKSSLEKNIVANLINRIKLSSDLLNIIYNVLESYIDWSYINTSSIGIGGPKLLAAQICDIHFNKFFVEINPEYIQKIGPNFEYFKSNYYFEDKLKYRSKDMSSVTDMPKTLKEKFIRFQKVYAPVNINDNNNDVSNDELNSFKYNDKMDILPIFNCDIWFGDYEGYDSFTRRYRVPYPITGLTYNDNGSFDDEILIKLEYCLRIILYLNEDIRDINTLIADATTGGASNFVLNLNKLQENIYGGSSNMTHDDRRNYFNNFFEKGKFKINNKDYNINNNDKNNNFYLFNIKIINNKYISINNKNISVNENNIIWLQYYVKFAINKAATYGLYSFKENKKCKEMRGTDKDLNNNYDKVPVNNDGKKCSFILTKPNNSTNYDQKLAIDLTEDNKSILYKSTKLITKGTHAKRVYPINKEAYNILPESIIKDQLGDNKNITDEPYYWIGYYDTFSYLNCNINFDREEEWNEMLTYNTTDESYNDMICYSSPLNYFNLSNKDKKIGGSFQKNTLDNNDINSLTGVTNGEFSFYDNNGSIYNDNTLVGGFNSLTDRLRSLQRSSLYNRDYSRSKFPQPTTMFNPSIYSAHSKETKDYKTTIDDTNKLVNLNNIRVGQPYMSASRIKNNTDALDKIKNSEGLYKKIIKNAGTNANMIGEGIKFKLILDRNYNISKSTVSKCRFPNRNYTNTTNIYTNLDNTSSAFLLNNCNYEEYIKSDKIININKEFYNCNTVNDYIAKYENLYNNDKEMYLSNLFVGYPSLKIKDKTIDETKKTFTNYFTNINYSDSNVESFQGVKNMKTVGPRLPPKDFVLQEYKQNENELSILSNKGYQHNIHKLIENYMNEYNELKNISG